MSKLIEDIRKPISKTEPCGKDVRYDDDYVGIQTEINKTAGNDWEMIMRLGSIILAQKSKNLNVATWLCIGLLQLQGFDGLADGLEGYLILLKEYWDDLYPQSERARVSALRMLSSKLGGDLSTMGLIEARQATASDAGALQRICETLKILDTEIQDKSNGTVDLRNIANAIEVQLQSIEVEIIEESGITGRVTDVDTNEAIPGAFVQISGADSNRTDSDGRFHLGDVPDGTYDITVTATGYDRYDGTVTVINKIANAEVNLRRKEVYIPVLSGTVTDVATRQPIPNAEIMTSPPTHTVLTNNTGQYQFNELAPGKYSVNATADNYKANSVMVEVKAAQAARADIQLAATGSNENTRWETRAEAIDTIIQAATFLRSQNPRDVIPYRILRSVRWDNQQLPSSDPKDPNYNPDWRGNKAPFSLPQSERKGGLETSVKSEDWEPLLKQSEELFAEGNCHFWLDLQRYISTALRGLGADYDAVRKVILRETAMLVNRLPKITELSYRDGTRIDGTKGPIPFADEETKAWIRKEVHPILSVEGTGVLKETEDISLAQVDDSEEQKKLPTQSEVTMSTSAGALASSDVQQIEVGSDGAKVEISIKIFTK